MSAFIPGIDKNQMSKKRLRRPQKHIKKQTRTMREWWQDQSPRTRHILLTCCLLGLVAVLGATVYYYGFYEDGSLKIRNGQVANAADNWLIAELSKGKNSRYYCLAEVDTPAGYVKSSESAFGQAITTSSNISHKTDLNFVPENDKNPIESISLYPLARSPKDMIEESYPTYQRMADTAASNGEKGEVSTLLERNTPFGQAPYFVFRDVYDSNGGVKYGQMLFMYLPCSYPSAGILLTVSTYPQSPAGYLPDETLLEEALKMIDCIHISAN